MDNPRPKRTTKTTSASGKAAGPASRRTKAQPLSPAESVKQAWSRIDGWLSSEDNRIPGLAGPASAPAMSAAAKFPASLRALHAVHDGAEGVSDVLGLGKMVWWSLLAIADGPRIKLGDRTFVVFGAPLDDEDPDLDELPQADDALDDVFAIDMATEEVVALNMSIQEAETVVEHLGVALERVAESLTSGALVLDENGQLQPPAAAPSEPPPPAAPAAPPPQAVREIAALLVSNEFVELRPGATAEDLAVALSAALEHENYKVRVKALFQIFDDDPLVVEVYADEDKLQKIVRQLA